MLTLISRLAANEAEYAGLVHLLTNGQPELTQSEFVRATVLGSERRALLVAISEAPAESISDMRDKAHCVAQQLAGADDGNGGMEELMLARSLAADVLHVTEANGSSIHVNGASDKWPHGQSPPYEEIVAI